MITDSRGLSDATREPGYGVLSRVKLALLSVSSFGLYTLYWFYRHWQTEWNSSWRRVWAALLALGSPVLAYVLFRRMRAKVREPGKPRIAPGLLALLYFGLTVIALRLPSPYWMMASLSCAPLVIVQTTLNRRIVRLTPEAARPDRFRLGSFAIVVLGAWLWVLVLLCTRSPLPE